MTQITQINADKRFGRGLHR